MRASLPIVGLSLCLASIAAGASPDAHPELLAFPGGPSLLRPESILRPNPARPGPAHRPAGRASVRRISDDDAGTATLSLEPTPELPDSEDAEAPVPPLSSEALQVEAVPLDGATPEEEAPEEPAWCHSYSSFGWVGGTGDQLGMLEWADRNLTTMYDYLDDQHRFLAEPGFLFRWLTGPNSPDLPPYLFNISIDIVATTKLNQDWALHLAMSPGWNTDFANKSADLFRLPWQVVNAWRVGDEWRLVGGITDLDREDIQYLPVAGVIYTPCTGEQEWSLVFPRPRAAWRLSSTGTESTWLSVTGELGGGSYSIQRAGAFHDIVTLRDYRLLVGWEKRGTKRRTTRLEAGWVFGRAVEFVSGIGNYDPGQTGMLRLSSDY